MKILAAGGAGFIGSHLIDRLLAEGHSVVCADKLVFGQQNIEHLLQDAELNKSGRFCFRRLDLADREASDRLFAEWDFDAVYHLAANSDIRRGGAEPEIDFNDTLLTTRCLLEGMRKTGVKKLFFASTSAVYGEMMQTQLCESTGGLRPVSYYGGAKLASEALISAYTAMCCLETVIFRFPNVIGPRLTHGVLYDFLRKLKNNPRQLEILGDGTQCKPYLYVADLVEAILQRTLCGVQGSGLELYNIGPVGEGTSVTRIAEIAVETMGLRDVRFLYTGGDRGWKGDVPRFSYNIDKIRSTGWNPEYSSEEAVRKAAECGMAL